MICSPGPAATVSAVIDSIVSMCHRDVEIGHESPWSKGNTIIYSTQVTIIEYRKIDLSGFLLPGASGHRVRDNCYTDGILGAEPPDPLSISLLISRSASLRSLYIYCYAV